MILRLILTATIAVGIASAAQATCGSDGKAQICTDEFGNIFLVDQKGNVIPANRPEPKTSAPDQQAAVVAIASQANERDQQRRSWKSTFATLDVDGFREPSFAELPSYSTWEGGPQ